MSSATEPHPDVQAILSRMEDHGVPQMCSLSVSEARGLLESLWGPPENPEAVDEVRDETVSRNEADVAVRVYEPGGDGPHPALVFFHGGGWVLGSLDTHDTTCRAITNAANCIVVSVDYRRPPEHPFPDPVEDCLAAMRWVSENHRELEIDPERLAVGGDSAGGNLAAVIAQIVRDEAWIDISHQVLLYPVVDYSFDTDSYDENAEGYFLTKDDMEWFWDLYLESEWDGQNPYASPLRTRTVHGLPPATVLTCGFDPLRDEGIAYAERLRDAGVPVTHRHYDDMIHGFVSLLADPELEQARSAVAEIGQDLQQSFEA